MSDKKTGYNPNSMNFGAKGWLFCLFSALVFFIPTALGSTWQMAVVYWEAAYGWNQVFILNMVTVGGLFTVIGAFLCGILVTKRLPRKLAIIWSAAYIIFLVIVGLSESLPLTCVCIVTVTMFGSNWCYNLNPVIVSNWFPRKKGLVMGIVTMGIPLAAGITTKILTWGFNNFGIRLMFMPYVVMAAIALVVLILFVTDNPEDRKFNPDNDRSMTMERAIEENKKALEMDAKSSWTTKRILQTKEVWIIALSRGTQLLYAGGVMVQMILAFMGRGYELEKAVNLMLATAICAMVGSYLMGYVDNLLGTRRAIQITSLVQQHSGLVNLIAYSAMCFIKYISWGLWVVSC